MSQHITVAFGAEREYVITVHDAEADALTKEQAREIYYGMPYEDWRAQKQTAASADKQAAFQKAFAENVGKTD